MTNRYQRKKRSFAPLNEEKLRRVAIDYLARYAASEAALRQVLERRILRQMMRDEGFAADTEKQHALRTTIDAIIASHKQTGALNDAAFAETKIASLRRSGASQKRIEQKLAHKGVAKDVVRKTLDAFDEDHDAGASEEGNGAEYQAALTFARKRRLGPFRTLIREELDTDAQRKQQARDIAALARAGFSYDIAKRVLGEGV